MLLHLKTHCLFLILTHNSLEQLLKQLQKKKKKDKEISTKKDLNLLDWESEPKYTVKAKEVR